MIDIHKLTPLSGTVLFLFTFGIIGNGCLNIFLFNSELFIQLDFYKIVLLSCGITFPLFISSFLFSSTITLTKSSNMDTSILTLYASSLTSILLIILTGIKSFNMGIKVEIMLCIYTSLIVGLYVLGIIYSVFKKKSLNSIEITNEPIQST